MSTNALPPGTILDRNLEVKRVLGEGGFGITYLVHDHDLQQDLVLKEFFPPAWVRRVGEKVVCIDEHEARQDFAHFLKRFLDEARIAAKVNHPNLVKVHRFFPSNGTGYFAMVWHEGETLQSLLKRQGAMTPAAVMRLIEPLLDGLEQFHSAGLIHRDIKPGNIYVRKDGSPLLLDFGSARAPANRSGPLTAVLSPGYAPFEQYSTDGIQGPHTDVYAVGAVLYRMLTGKEPLDAYSRRGDASATPRHVPCVEAAPTSVPFALSSVVDQAMAMEVNKRIADAPSLRNALREALTKPTVKPSQAQHSAPINSPNSSKKRASTFRKPWRIALVAAALAVIAAAIAISLWWPSKQSEPSSVQSAGGEVAPALQLNPVQEPIAASTNVSFSEDDLMAGAFRYIRTGEPILITTCDIDKNGFSQSAESVDIRVLKLLGPGPQVQEAIVEFYWRACGGTMSNSSTCLVTRQANSRIFSADCFAEYIEDIEVSGRTLKFTAQVTDNHTGLACDRSCGSENCAVDLLTDGKVGTKVCRLTSGTTFADTFGNGSYGPKMVVVPAGKYLRGSPASEVGRDPDESPVREVEVSRFAVSVSPVTREEFKAFIESASFTTDAEKGRCGTGAGASEQGGDYAALTQKPKQDWRDPAFPGFEQTPDHPVVCVSWNDAQAYVAWVSKETQTAYRLPTEAELEFILRAGQNSVFPWGENSNDACGYGNFHNCEKTSDPFTRPVGSGKPNAFGVYDLVGNVKVWGQDCFTETYEHAPVNGTATKAENCVTTGPYSRKFVVRGTSWAHHEWDEKYWRNAYRSGMVPTGTTNTVGFRVARSLD